MPRFAFSEPSIGSTTTRTGRPPERALAELLGDEREAARSSALEPGDDGVLGGGVDRRRVVAALAAPQHGLALDPGRAGRARTPRMSATHARQSSSQGHGSHAGGRAGRRASFGIEVRRLLRHHLAAARTREHVLDPRRPQRGRRRPPRRGRRGATASRQSGVYAIPRGRSRSTSSTSSSPGSPSTSAASPVAVDDRRGALVRRRREPRERVLESSGRLRRRLDRAAGSREDRCVGKISSPGSAVETSTASIRALSGVPSSREGERGLVAVVAVGDQQLPLGEELARRRRRRRRRQSRAPSTSRSGVAVGRRERRCAVVEQEDRLELRARRAKQAQPALLRAARASARAAARRRVSYGSARSEATRPVARPRDAVRARRSPARAPRRRLVVAHEHALARASRGSARPPPPPSRRASGGRRCAGRALEQRSSRSSAARRRRTAARRARRAARRRRAYRTRGTAATSAIGASVPSRPAT